MRVLAIARAWSETMPSVVQSMTVILVLLWASAGLAQQPAPEIAPLRVKHIAAPPEDMASGMLSLPDPASLPIVSRSALIPVQTQLIEGVWRWSMPIDVNHNGARIALLPAEHDAWTVSLAAPDQTKIAARLGTSTDPRVRIGSDPLEWIVQDREFTHLTIHKTQQEARQGQWVIEVIADHRAPGYVLIESGSGTTLSTHVETQSTLKNQPITLVSKLSNNARLDSLVAHITSPLGISSTERAHPGSAHLTFFPEETGNYTIRMIANGQSQQGHPVHLTTQHVVCAEDPAPLLNAPKTTADESRVVFGFDADESSRRAILAAEVWGRRSGSGALTPVAWISNIVGSTRSLTLDTRWIALTDVDPGTLELRALRLHDVDSLVPIEVVERVPVPIDTITLPQAPKSITQDMLTGSFDQTVLSPIPSRQANASGSVGGGHRLMLVHGYCTDSNPYPTSHFSGDLAVFEDFNQSRSHDEFALQIMAQAAPMKSFGVVAPSQGGIASLHLLNFYWSGLDWARDGTRRIQTVGSPYQGTALAGNAAVLGDIFRFGCG